MPEVKVEADSPAVRPRRQAAQHLLRQLIIETRGRGGEGAEGGSFVKTGWLDRLLSGRESECLAMQCRRGWPQHQPHPRLFLLSLKREPPSHSGIFFPPGNEWRIPGSFLSAGRQRFLFRESGNASGGPSHEAATRFASKGLTLCTS